MIPPTEQELKEFRRRVSPQDFGIGLLDTRSGRIYLSVASALVEGDHASLAEEALGIDDVDQAGHLRGFVVGVAGSSWQFANCSGMNPQGLRMERELFDEVVATLMTVLNEPGR